MSESMVAWVVPNQNWRSCTRTATSAIRSRTNAAISFLGCWVWAAANRTWGPPPVRVWLISNMLFSSLTLRVWKTKIGCIRFFTVTMARGGEEEARGCHYLCGSLGFVLAGSQTGDFYHSPDPFGPHTFAPMSPRNERPAWLQGPAAQCETPVQTPPTPYRLVLLGAPGVGKGTQADLLHRHLGACHLSTGDVFRAAGSQPECNQSPAMKEALAYMRRGELVPDSTVWDLVRERKTCLDCRSGFILDG